MQTWVFSPLLMRRDAPAKPGSFQGNCRRLGGDCSELGGHRAVGCHTWTPLSILLRNTEQSTSTSSAAPGWRGCWKAKHPF